MRLRFTDGALRAVAREALRRKSGARGPARDPRERDARPDVRDPLPRRRRGVHHQRGGDRAGSEAAPGRSSRRRNPPEPADRGSETRADGHLPERRRRAHRRDEPEQRPVEVACVPLLPLRDIVVFPHMVVPLFVGPRASRSGRSRRRWPATASCCSAAQKRGRARTSPARTTSTRSARSARSSSCCACPTAPSRCWSRARRARGSAASSRREPFFAVRGRGGRGAGGARRRGRGAGAHRPLGLRELRQAQQEDSARDAHHRARDRRAGPARRHHRRAPRASSSRRSRSCSRPSTPSEAARGGLRAHAGRDRDPRGRAQDPRPRQEADGEDAEGVLPQRADAGDPEGARRAGRVQERDRGARGAAQEEEDARRRRERRPRRRSASSR